MKKKDNKIGFALIGFLLLTSMLGVFQFINVNKFSVEVIVSMSKNQVYRQEVQVDDNSTAVNALTKFVGAYVENNTLQCVSELCNEGDNFWAAMNAKGRVIDPINYKVSDGELVYFIYVTNDTQSQTVNSSKVEMDNEAIRNLLKS